MWNGNLLWMKETVTGGAGEGGEASDPGAVDGAEHRGFSAWPDDLPSNVGDHGGGGDGDWCPGAGHLLLLTTQGGDGDRGGLGLTRDRDHPTRAWRQYTE